ncbi:MAG: right-handed parallel beta-helix repeat-containing protein [Clostridium sp.]|nr:right-handed parallel beta-helix repeat-containing protein [Clostridium sp.]
MKKLLLNTFILLLFAVAASAEDYKTPGDGTVWTLGKLAAEAASGVTAEGNVYTMTQTVEIAGGDRFRIESGIIVKMADGVKLTLSGEADLAATERVLFTAASPEDKPYGLFIDNDQSVTTLANLDFEYAGVRNFGGMGLIVTDCTFRYHNGVSGASALNLGTSGASFHISGCTFEECGRSAISNAANYLNPVTIENCTLKGNGTQNTNTPQINLTVSENTVIRNNVIIGNPALNNVGGIVVSNLVGLTGNLNTLIEGNDIRDNRFGLATYCEQHAVIRNNKLVNNKYEKIPNNGGSGINIYDPYQTQVTRITGNYIEGNLWGITVIGGKDVNIGKTEDPEAEDYNPGLNVLLNNGFDGQKYDLYNNSANTVYAQGNYWKTVDVQDETHIEEVIFHKADDSRLGEVIFMPALTQDPTGIAPATADSKVRRVEVYGINGARVATLPTSDLSNLRPGIYTVRILTDTGVTTRKVVR